MEARELTFSESGDEYKATFTSQGEQVMQLARKAGGWLGVYAYIDGMEPVPIYAEAMAGQFVLLNVLVPSGMKVDVHSRSEVATGKLLTGEEQA